MVSCCPVAFCDAQLNAREGKLNMKYYVDAKRPDNEGDGLSWLTSKKDIQAALELSHDGDEIIVQDGVYPPFVSKRNKILIQSVNGPRETVINAHLKSRCASFVSPENVLDGFRLLNGFSGNDVGGGVMGGTLNNCLIVNCETAATGGGAYGSVLNDCVLFRNFSYWNAGGASNCSLTNCRVLENEARPDDEGEGGYAGGVWGCVLETCEIKNNKAQITGGAACQGVFI